MVSPSLKFGMISAAQCCGVGQLKPNTILLGFLSDTSPESCERYVEIVRSMIALNKVVMIVKGLSNFPGTSDRQTGTIDVYWVIHDGGVLTLITHLLMRHHVWKNCKMRIFAVVCL
jgi:potassium/chloride transporter 4/5/6